eukprot:m.181522 g.181522  ORF g.181522 m.181522 type:complete len:613 (+) comp39276_c1_seq11:387-2225(+)
MSEVKRTIHGEEAVTLTGESEKAEEQNLPENEDEFQGEADDGNEKDSCLETEVETPPKDSAEQLISPPSAEYQTPAEYFIVAASAPPPLEGVSNSVSTSKQSFHTPPTSPSNLRPPHTATLPASPSKDDFSYHTNEGSDTGTDGGNDDDEDDVDDGDNDDDDENFEQFLRPYLGRSQKESQIIASLKSCVPGPVKNLVTTAKSFFHRNSPARDGQRLLLLEKKRQAMADKKRRGSERVRQMKRETKKKFEELKRRQEERRRQVKEKQVALEKERREKAMFQADEKDKQRELRRERAKYRREALEEMKKTELQKKMQEVEARRRQEDESRQMQLMKLEEERRLADDVMKKRKAIEDEERLKKAEEQRHKEENIRKEKEEREAKLKAEAEAKIKQKTGRDKEKELKITLDKIRKEAEENNRFVPQLFHKPSSTKPMIQQKVAALGLGKPTGTSSQAFGKSPRSPGGPYVMSMKSKFEEAASIASPVGAVGRGTFTIGNATAATPQNDRQLSSYDLTPAHPMEDYGIDDIDSSDDTDDDENPAKPIPLWASGDHLKASLSSQFCSVGSDFDPDLVFPDCKLTMTCDLSKLFGRTRTLRYVKRTSSAQWNSPPFRR